MVDALVGGLNKTLNEGRFETRLGLMPLTSVDRNAATLTLTKEDRTMNTRIAGRGNL